MCDNKNLSGKIYTGVPTVVVSCVVFLNFLFTSIFFFTMRLYCFVIRKRVMNMWSPLTFSHSFLDLRPQVQ